MTARIVTHGLPATWESAIPGASAAWLYGAAEALGVLSRRLPADRERAAEHAVKLLISNAGPADWERVGFVSAAEAVQRAAEPAEADESVEVTDPAVLRLARAAASLRCSTMPKGERHQVWARVAHFFSKIAAAEEPMLRRIRATVLYQRAEAGEQSDQVVDELLSSYEWYRATYGHSAYLTSLARTDLGVAYRQRAAVGDLALAEKLFREEIGARTLRYGAGHPFMLVARNLLASCLLEQAEAAVGPDERRRLALRAYDEAEDARVARDVLFGATAANSTLSRRHQGHALLLVGEPDSLHRALACLQCVLARETKRNGNVEWRGSGHTHLLLSRVYHALGDATSALRHAESAQRLLCADAPDAPLYQDALAMVGRLSNAFSSEAGSARKLSILGELPEMDAVEGNQLSARELALVGPEETFEFAARPDFATVGAGDHWSMPLLLLTDHRLVISKDKLIGKRKADFAADWKDVIRVNGEPWMGVGTRIQLIIQTRRADIELIAQPLYAVDIESAIRSGYMRLRGQPSG